MSQVHVRLDNEVYSVQDNRDVIVTLFCTRRRDFHFTILRSEYERVLDGQHKFYKIVNAPVVSKTTNPSPIKVAKSGTKAERAVDLYKSLGENPSKESVIELFIRELNMTKAGATTYFYATKKVVK